jgi:hypothetical protein
VAKSPDGPVQGFVTKVSYYQLASFFTKAQDLQQFGCPEYSRGGFFTEALTAAMG